MDEMIFCKRQKAENSRCEILIEAQNEKKKKTMTESNKGKE